MKYDELIGKLRGCEGYRCEDCELRREEFCNLVRMEKAADVIEELQNKLNLWRQDKIRRWIPITERLPEVGKSVLVISYGRVCFAKLLLTINNGGYPTFVLQDGLNNPPVLETTAHNEFTENRITHWQYLPEPPKDGE